MRAAEAVKRFNETAPIAYLATVDGDRPRVRPMVVLGGEGNCVYLAAASVSDKITQIADNPHVEICYMDAEQNHLRINGTAEVTDDAALKRRLWQENGDLRRYFASAEDPRFALLKVTIAEALLMEAPSLKY